MSIKISSKLAESLLTYLSSKPFREVAKLIGELSTSPEIEDREEKKVVTEDKK